MKLKNVIMVQDKTEELTLTQDDFYQALLRDLSFEKKDEPLIHLLAMKELIQATYEELKKGNSVVVSYDRTSENEILFQRLLDKFPSLEYEREE